MLKVYIRVTIYKIKQGGRCAEINLKCKGKICFFAQIL